MEEVKLLLVKEPFPHVIIENFYTHEELALIWRELEFLTASQKLIALKSTANKDGVSLSTSVGLSLDAVYNIREVSDILTINRKIFAPEVLSAIASVHPLMNGIINVNSDRTMIRYYENEGYYKPHFDTPRFTAASYFYKEPKEFLGGDLYFSDFDYAIPIKNNMVVVFMGSALKHASTELIMNSNSLPFNGMGKYSMMQFLDEIARNG